MLARKIVAKAASETEVNEFRELQVRLKRPCEDLEYEAKVSIVMHYRNLRSAFSKTGQGTEELNELRAFLAKHDIPFSIPCIQRRAVTGKSSGVHMAHRFSRKDSEARVELSLLLVEDKATESDKDRFVALYQKYGIAIEAAGARHVASLYLSRRLDHLKQALRAPPGAVEMDREAVDEEARTISETLKAHCGTATKKVISRNKMLLTGAPSANGAPVEAITSCTGGLDTPVVSSPNWDEFFEGRN